MSVEKIKKLLAIDKFQKFIEIIRFNGGVLRSLYQLYRMDALKIGCLVGEDEYGNKYYQNNSYFFGTNRWVEYNQCVGMNYDASQVPPEWHGWLHYKTDCPPNEDEIEKYPWMAKHTENMSGTSEAYMPYSTTRPKIHPWVPPKPKCKDDE